EFLFEVFPQFLGIFPLGLLLEGTVCFGVPCQASPWLLKKDHPYLGLSRTCRRPGVFSNPAS
ncbi:hypothetical protein NDU88_003695, partial [Pleurodeles waltl]